MAFAQDVADILVNPEGKEATGGERFFEDSVRALLTGVILHALYTESRPSLGSCAGVGLPDGGAVGSRPHAAAAADRAQPDHPAADPGGPPGPAAVLLMLDEFTALGKLDFMHRGIGFFRGYGIRVFLSIQSLEQLFQIYGQHQSIGANCGVQVAYGANDVATAKLLSEMTGRRTVEYRRQSRNGGFFGGRRSEGEVEAGRPLLSPDEVRQLPEGEALVYVAGCAPIRGARVPYWRDPELARRAGVPAPGGSDRVQH